MGMREGYRKEGKIEIASDSSGKRMLRAYELMFRGAMAEETVLKIE